MNISQPPDEFDARILDQLQEDGRQSFAKIAKKVGLSLVPCWRRVRTMRDQKVILGYRALIDQEKVGLGVGVFLNVTLDRKTKEDVDKFEAAVKNRPEVIECYEMSGRADYLLKVLVANIKEYRAFLMEYLMEVPGVRDVESSFVLHTVKSNTKLPIKITSSYSQSPTSQ